MHFLQHSEELLRQVFDLLDLELRKYLNSFPLHLEEVSSSYFSVKGKGLRPLLLLLACEAAGGNLDNAYSVAAALEVFHNWTLVHDDIIDNDKIRRNQETAHIRGARLGKERWDLDRKSSQEYGRSLAILAGDSLQGAVINLLCAQKNLPPKLQLALVSDLANSLYPQLLSGEQLDIELSYENLEKIREEDIFEMMRLKTGALLGFCAETGVRIAQSSDESIPELAKELREFAQFAGIAFQLQDDILGIASTEEEFGKNIASDLREGKRTLPLLYSWEMCNAMDKKKIANVLGNAKADQEKLEEACEIIKSSGALEKTSEVAERYLQRALEILDAATPNDEAKKNLKSWTKLIVDRKR